MAYDYDVQHVPVQEFGETEVMSGLRLMNDRTNLRVSSAVTFGNVG